MSVTNAVGYLPLGLKSRGKTTSSLRQFTHPILGNRSFFLYAQWKLTELEAQPTNRYRDATQELKSVRVISIFRNAFFLASVITP